MSKLGNCAPCAAAASPIPMLGKYSRKPRGLAGLGSCGPCAAASTPLMFNGLGDWYSELKTHLRPMAPWMVAAAAISGYAGFKLGKWYCSNLFLQREALVATGIKKRKKRKRK